MSIWEFGGCAARRSLWRLRYHAAEYTGCSTRRRGYRRRLTVAVGVLVLAVFCGCGGGERQSLAYGTYVFRLCEALGPFQQHAQRLGRLIGRDGIRPRSRTGQLAVEHLLGARIADSRRVDAMLLASGVPRIAKGEQLAAALKLLFHEIEDSDVRWRASLRVTHRAPQLRREVGAYQATSLRALVLVGDAVERLPSAKERRLAMSRSPVCRRYFGGGSPDGTENLLGLVAHPGSG